MDRFSERRRSAADLKKVIEDKDRRWFRLILDQMKELTKRKDTLAKGASKGKGKMKKLN